MSPSTRLRPVHSLVTASLAVSLAASLAACGTDADSDPTPPGDEPAGCARGTLEPDLAFLQPMAGPAVDPATGAIAPPPAGGYVISSTYLAMRPEPAAQQRFGQLMGPISQALATQPGLLALQLGASQSCGTARTFAVWSSEDALYDYVTGPAHSAAAAAVAEVSRGGSVVTHWTATAAAQMSWQAAAARLADFDGPTY